MRPPDHLIERIAEAAKNTRRLYSIYISILVYCVATVLVATDRHILLNETVRLPVINSNVSLTGFFLFSPILFIVIFLYIQIHLYPLRKAVINARKKYSVSIKEHLYPWIVLSAEEPEKGFIGCLQKAYVFFGLWLSLPLVLFLYSFLIVKKHDALLSYFVVAEVLLGTALVSILWWKYENIAPQKGLRKKTIILSVILIVFILESLLVIFAIPWASEGRRWGPPRDYGGLRSFIGSWLVADLRREILVKKPAQDWPYLYWADLSGKHLEGADLTGSVLKRANLRKAKLQNANMATTNLSGANLSEANLGGAEMINSDLEGALLYSTNLAGASLSLANLKNTTPNQANFQGALLAEANLEGAKLYRCMFKGAALTKANLRGANLNSSDLQRVDGRWADFAEANLENVYLDGSDLRYARNLTIEQLSKVRTLYNTKLDPELMSEISNKYKHLLEKPDEDRRPNIRFDKIYPGWDKGPDWSKIIP